MNQQLTVWTSHRVIERRQWYADFVIEKIAPLPPIGHALMVQAVQFFMFEGFETAFDEDLALIAAFTLRANQNHDVAH